jgi:hypothetical protein
MADERTSSAARFGVLPPSAILADFSTGANSTAAPSDSKLFFRRKKAPGLLSLESDQDCRFE